MSLSERDSNVIWHPYTQMLAAPAHIGIVRGEGSYLYAEDGTKYIDGISSWWTNIHGHSHPYLAQKLLEQASILEHVIFAGFTHEPAILLAEQLIGKLPGNLEKIFYSDNGSTAVEVALKMALQFWHNREKPRTRMIAFREAYHGDTFGAMSVSGRSAFTHAFDTLLFDVIFIAPPLPGMEEQVLHELEAILETQSKEIAAFIYEPLVQGTAGMKIMSVAGLDALVKRCKAEQIICIADEVMTGFGRTGKMFASEYLHEQADIICLSKGLTGGTMALGVSACNARIYDAFLSHDKMKTFFHGHSYTANPLACAMGVASLELFEKERTLEKIKAISVLHEAFIPRIKGHKRVRKVNTLGVLLVIELETGSESSYFNQLRDQAYAYFLKAGILMRPLGNVLYLMPPYCIAEADLIYIYQTIQEYLDSLP
jgi:adenosylmethionine-8-amino-7-oxononanoate aminotransferase